MIEEEQYSDPDHSSVYTSDDDFESDEGLQADYAVQNPIRFATDASQDNKRMSQKTSSLNSPRKLLRGIGGDKIMNSFSSAAHLRNTPSRHEVDNSSSRSPRVGEMQTHEHLATDESDEKGEPAKSGTKSIGSQSVYQEKAKGIGDTANQTPRNL